MNKADATSFYRAAGVAGDLENKIGAVIDVMDWTEKTLTWTILSNYDIVWMQRPISPESVNAAKYLKLMEKPIWVDYDDDLFSLPTTHPMIHIFAGARDNIIALLQMADVVTVSTIGIRNSFEAYNGNIQVVPNSCQDSLLRPYTGKRSNVILYRGMKSHMADIYSYSIYIQKLIDDGHPVKFIGINPFFLNKYTLLEERDIYHYFKYLQDIRPLCLIFPLIDNTFNRAKSNICWIEATMCGSVVIAPDWPEWDYPGILHYVPGTFYDVVKRVVMGQVEIEQLYQTSYQYISENLVLSKVNELRVNVVRELISKEKQP